MPVGRNEREAAYFALLRAREELNALRRYGDYLDSERRRLQRFVAEGDALDAHVDRRLRRRVSHTDEDLAKAIRARLETVDGELDRLPDRVAGAEAFVEESEEDLARLRSV